MQSQISEFVLRRQTQIDRISTIEAVTLLLKNNFNEPSVVEALG